MIYLLFFNQDIRQRHRYLCHLPLTCEFSICELALKPPILSKETLELFSGWYCLSSRLCHVSVSVKGKSFLSLNGRKKNIHSFTCLAPTVWWLLDRTTPIHCFIDNNYTKNKKAWLLGRAYVVCKHILLLMCYNWICCSQSWRKHCQSIGVGFLISSAVHCS